MEARPGVKRGCDVPKSMAKIKARLADEKGAEEYAKNSSKWIVEGMGKDAERK